VRRLLACDTAIYVGDDDTDEDAFGSAGSHRLLAIRVGRRAVDELLRLLLEFRPLRRSRMT
jgi:hypothetical protein